MSAENPIKAVLKEQAKNATAPLDISADKVQEQLTRTTSIPILDRTMGGGLPSGSVVYIHSDPKSMAEVFLYQFTQARKTYYFSTERRPAYVMQDIKNYGFKPDNVLFVDIYSQYFLTGQGEMVDNVGNEFVDAKIVEFTEGTLRKILTQDESDINIIFDSFSFYLNLNVNPGSIKRLINTIYETSKRLNCLSFLYGLKGSHKNNIENDILKSCDVIFDIELEKSGDKLVNRLSIPKLRGRVPTMEMVKFRVSDGIQIDTTKDIA
ncbi:KaiC [uncultured archaeon]|nr:KaiC [uncultured archaeon]